MSTLSELLKEKNSLPIGNIYEKKINGNIYTYYQYFENGKRYTHKVDDITANELYVKIQRRKQIEKIIKEIKAVDKIFTLSKNAEKLTGSVMSGNKVVATFDHGSLIRINNRLAPLSIIKTHSLESFLSLRKIDMTRSNARLLKKALNIHMKDENKIPLSNYALSITDNYWFRPKHSKLKYQNINFKNDIYFDLSLKGDTSVFPRKNKLTPEITTPGSFEKGWKLINNSWWLYKVGNQKQIFSELFSYHFAKLIGLNTAIYEFDSGYIRTKNFAEHANFEPIAAIAGSDDNYENVFNVIYGIDNEMAKDYLRLIMFDCVVYNIDRHNENLGLLRDRKTGKIVSLAPNFDNNMALLSTIDELRIPEKDNFIKGFVEFIKNNEKARDLYKQIKFKNITVSQVDRLFDNIPIKNDQHFDIAEKICLRYRYLKTLFK